MQEAANLGADMVELRLDFLSSPPTHDQLKALLTDTPVEVIVTNRPRSEGGHFSGTESQRLEILRLAASFKPAYVDVEMSVPPCEAPQGRLIVSHHDFAGCGGDLEAIATDLAQTPGVVKKVVCTAGGPQDALRTLGLLRTAKKPTIALAMGEAGVLSRILAKKFGAFGTFASLRTGAESAPGQVTIEQMRDLYRWEAIGPETDVYGVIGCPVAHSLSPAIHNAAFAAAAMDAVYVPVLIQPGPDSFGRFMDELLARSWLDWRGLSVTLPHKQNALAYVGADRCDELARRIGAINTITIGSDGSLRGDNADYAAAIDSLCAAMGIERDGLAALPVAVLGAGGVARAIVAALTHYRADVAIYNRTVSRGEKLAEEFSSHAYPLAAATRTEAQILINCTSIGMHPDLDASPVQSIGSSVNVVFDTIYNPIETRLLKQAAAAGCTCVSGLEMFVNQAVAQFEIWTGRDAPRQVMRHIVTDHLSNGGD